MFGDSFFKKVESKTNVDKNTILSLAQKMQDSNMKDEKTIRDLIQEISAITGKSVSKEKEDKIVNTNNLFLLKLNSFSLMSLDDDGMHYEYVKWQKSLIKILLKWKNIKNQ